MQNKNVYHENEKFQLHGNNSVCVGALQLLFGRTPAQLRGHLEWE
jgi:hypothetical protein